MARSVIACRTHLLQIPGMAVQRVVGHLSRADQMRIANEIDAEIRAALHKLARHANAVGRGDDPHRIDKAEVEE